MIEEIEEVAARIKAACQRSYELRVEKITLDDVWGMPISDADRKLWQDKLKQNALDLLEAENDYARATEDMRALDIKRCVLTDQKHQERVARIDATGQAHYDALAAILEKLTK